MSEVNSPFISVQTTRTSEYPGRICMTRLFTDSACPSSTAASFGSRRYRRKRSIRRASPSLNTSE